MPARRRWRACNFEMRSTGVCRVPSVSAARRAGIYGDAARAPDREEGRGCARKLVVPLFLWKNKVTHGRFLQEKAALGLSGFGCRIPVLNVNYSIDRASGEVLARRDRESDDWGQGAEEAPCPLAMLAGGARGLPGPPERRKPGVGASTELAEIYLTGCSFRRWSLSGFASVGIVASAWFSSD